MNGGHATPARRRATAHSLGIAVGAIAALSAGNAWAQVVANVATVPSFAPAANANETQALPGFPETMHLQILIDPVHLQPLVGHSIQGLRFRRQMHQHTDALFTGQFQRR